MSAEWGGEPEGEGPVARCGKPVSVCRFPKGLWWPASVCRHPSGCGRRFPRRAASRRPPSTPASAPAPSTGRFAVEPPAVGVVVNWGVTIPALRFLVRGMHGGCSWGRPRPLGVRGRPVRNGSVVEWCAHDLTRLSEALACEPEDGGAVDESVGTGDGCCLGWEEGLPVAESPIRC